MRAEDAIRRIALITAVLLPQVAVFAGESLRSQQEPSSISDMRSNNPKPAAFNSISVAPALRKSRRDFAAAPPSNLAVELTEAVLPATSAKEHALPDLSKANFLAPHRFQESDFQNSYTLGLNRSRIRSAKHPDVSGAR